MKLDDLLLKKEEIPIIINKENFLLSTLFEVPIHPKLLSPYVRIDENLARSVFPQAAKEWYADLQETAKSLEKGEAKDYIKRLFLSKPLLITSRYGEYVVDPPGFWESNVVTMENGFANAISINRDGGGSLYLDREHTSCMFPSPAGFSKEKLLEFSCYKKIDADLNSVEAHIYYPHNIDYYPGALFLRNWAILYLNEALKQADTQKPF